MGNNDIMVNALTGGVTGYSDFQYDGSNLSVTGTTIAFTGTTITLAGVVYSDSLQTTSTTDPSYSITAPGIILVNATDNDVTIRLPSIANTNQLFTIKRVDGSANAVTIQSEGGEYIDGEASYAIATQYESVTLVSDGVNWHKI